MDLLFTILVAFKIAGLGDFSWGWIIASFFLGLMLTNGKG